MDPNMANYDPNATIDDGSCEDWNCGSYQSAIDNSFNWMDMGQGFSNNNNGCTTCWGFQQYPSVNPTVSSTFNYTEIVAGSPSQGYNATVDITVNWNDAHVYAMAGYTGNDEKHVVIRYKVQDWQLNNSNQLVLSGTIDSGTYPNGPHNSGSEIISKSYNFTDHEFHQLRVLIFVVYAPRLAADNYELNNDPVGYYSCQVPSTLGDVPGLA